MACGTGMRVRRRDCNSPPPMDGGLYCKGESEQEEECVQKPCPRECLLVYLSRNPAYVGAFSYI